MLLEEDHKVETTCPWCDETVTVLDDGLESKDVECDKCFEVFTLWV